jgi:hypothetical protein
LVVVVFVGRLFVNIYPLQVVNIVLRVVVEDRGEVTDPRARTCVVANHAGVP